MIGAHTVLVYADRDAPTGAPVDVTCLLDDVAVVHGRSDSTSQPAPSAATLNVTVGPGAPLPPELDIGAWLIVDTEVGGVTYRRFTGRVSDISIGWDDAGPNTPDAGVGQVIAVSVLADYARRVVGDEPFPPELDGARVARVFALAGLDLDPATSDPGVVQVNPRDIDSRAALEVAQGTANSGGGLIWETREGDIRYADSEHRRGADVDLELDACDILVTPTWARNLSGMVNQIHMGYGLPPEAIEGEPSEGSGQAPVYYAENETSVLKWGRYAYSVTTELARWEDAYTASALILSQNAGPVWMLDALPVDMGGLSLADTQTLLGLDVHALIRVTGLPETGPTPTAIAAWVEGWSERLAWGVHDLQITVSDYCRTVPGPRWNDIPDQAQTWDATTGTWDAWACTGGPVPDLGRWDDTSASTRWDSVPSEVAWDETGAGVPG
jgi:hypothetical protein